MLFSLDDTPPDTPFPEVHFAETEPNGLLAVGGDLGRERLLQAYRKGVFPWFNDDQPILWWSPDPRMVLFTDAMKIPRSLRKILRNGGFEVSFNQAFEAVIDACAAPRSGQDGTWIVPEMRASYVEMHAAGYARSVEVWHAGELVGGLYGVALGRVFFGESMFSRRSNASKVALVCLCRLLRAQGWPLIDCQVYSGHLASLGAVEIPRRLFNRHLEEHIDSMAPPAHWPDGRQAGGHCTPGEIATHG